LADPVRPTVPAAIQECRTAGIRVVMITGDYPVTAQNIAKQIGLNGEHALITGPELEAMSDEELARKISTVSVFARVVPEQKLRIVQALKANGEIVAMTGDGVNDAPALKSAHIGIAMGGRGTDVARESASLVLLDDDFSSIVAAVKLGRRIFDNIRKAVSYIFAIHIPIVGLSMLPAFFKDWPLILMPVHVVFLELIIDPACSIIFEAEAAEPDTMQRPPRDPKERLFSLKSVGLSLLQGASVLGFLLAVFFFFQTEMHDPDTTRAMVFTTLIIANVLLILTNRSQTRSLWVMLREPNAAVWWVVGGAMLMLTAVLYTPFFRGLFHFSRLALSDVGICLGMGVGSIVWFEIVKAMRRKSLR
ncbi:TPA: ATPase, partial [Candidatus Sumerlaeota bacterium]|nr:ATPase [Candidatus Sumerlaeota bacterium]